MVEAVEPVEDLVVDVGVVDAGPQHAGAVDAGAVDAGADVVDDDVAVNIIGREFRLRCMLHVYLINEPCFK